MTISLSQIVEAKPKLSVPIKENNTTTVVAFLYDIGYSQKMTGERKDILISRAKESDGLVLKN